MTMRWVLLIAGAVVVWFVVREVTAYRLGCSTIRRGQLFLRLAVGAFVLVTLLSIARGGYWLLPVSCLGGAVLLALADASISRRRIREEAEGRSAVGSPRETTAKETR